MKRMHFRILQGTYWTNHLICFLLSPFLQDVKSGLFKEVARLEDKGRLEFHTQSQYLKSLDNLVRRGHHVLVDVDVNLKSLIGLDFSREGIAFIIFHLHFFYHPERATSQSRMFWYCITFSSHSDHCVSQVSVISTYQEMASHRIPLSWSSKRWVHLRTRSTKGNEMLLVKHIISNRMK